MNKLNDFIKRSGGISQSLSLINYEITQITKVMLWYASIHERVDNNCLEYIDYNEKIKVLKDDYVSLCILKRRISNGKV